MWVQDIHAHHRLWYKKGAQKVKAEEASTETLGNHYFDDMLTEGNS